MYRPLRPWFLAPLILAAKAAVIAMGGLFAQGFHLAKPMTAKRLQQWLE